jgi:hypothetical protein
VELGTAVTLTAFWICVPASAPELLVRSGIVLEHDVGGTVTVMVLGVQGQDPVTKTVAVMVCVTVVGEVWEVGDVTVEFGPPGCIELEIEVARLIADELETPPEPETLMTLLAVELVWAAEDAGPLSGVLNGWVIIVWGVVGLKAREDADALLIEVLLVTLLLTLETVDTGVKVDVTVKITVDVVVLLVETELDACTVTVEVTVWLVWTVIVVSVWLLWELVGLGETVSMGGVLDGWVLDDWVIVAWGVVGPKERVPMGGRLVGWVKVSVRVWPNTVFVSIDTETEAGLEDVTVEEAVLEVWGTVEIEVRFTVLGTGDVPISTDELRLEDVKDELREVLEALEEVTWVLKLLRVIAIEEVVGCVIIDSGVGVEVEEEELEICQRWKGYIGITKSAGSNLTISGKTGEKKYLGGTKIVLFWIMISVETRTDDCDDAVELVTSDCGVTGPGDVAALGLN